MTDTVFADSPEIQAKVLGAVISDTDFCRAVRKLLKPEHFTSDEMWIICGMAYEHYDRYGSALRDLAKVKLEDYIRMHQCSGDKAELLREALAALPYDPSMSEPLLDGIARFARHRELDRVLSAFLPAMEQGAYTSEDLDRLLEQIDQTRDYASMFRLRTDLAAGLDQRHRRRFDQVEMPPVATLIPMLDERFLGLRKGQLGTVMAPSGIGKSWMLVHLGKAAMYQGCRVFHATLEITAEDVEDRYDQMMVGVPAEGLSGAAAYRKMADEMARIESQGGHAQVVRAKKRTTVPELIRLMESYEQREGRAFDMFILDYGDLAGERASARRWEGDPAVWEDLADLALDRPMLVWTATQTNRAGHGAEVLGPHEVGGAIDKYNISDVWIGLNRYGLYDAAKRKWIETADGQADDDGSKVRLYVSKHRKGGRGDRYKVTFHSDLDRGLFFSHKVTYEHLADAGELPDDLNDIEEMLKMSGVPV